MSEEKLGGFGIRRKVALKTKNGIVLYLKEGNWVVDCPDGYKTFRSTFAEVLSFLAFINEGKSLKEARKIVGWKTTV